jgi:hypothetical protein
MVTAAFFALAVATAAAGVSDGADGVTDADGGVVVAEAAARSVPECDPGERNTAAPMPSRDRLRIAATSRGEDAARPQAAGLGECLGECIVENSKGEDRARDQVGEQGAWVAVHRRAVASSGTALDGASFLDRDRA